MAPLMPYIHRMGVCMKMNVFEAKQKHYVGKIVCSVELVAEEGIPRQSPRHFFLYFFNKLFIYVLFFYFFRRVSAG